MNKSNELSLSGVLFVLLKLKVQIDLFAICVNTWCQIVCLLIIIYNRIDILYGLVVYSCRPNFSLALSLFSRLLILPPSPLPFSSLTIEFFSWYHGKISRDQAEDILRNQPDFSFLVRNSESCRMDYSLSIRSVSIICITNILMKKVTSLAISSVTFTIKELFPIIAFSYQLVL